MLVELETAGVEGVEDMAVQKCPGCGIAWIEHLCNQFRTATCPSVHCGKNWCRNCSLESHEEGRCRSFGKRMEQWRLPVQGFSLSTVLSSRVHESRGHCAKRTEQGHWRGLAQVRSCESGDC